MKHIKLFETFINEDGPIWDKMKSVYQDAKKVYLLDLDMDQNSPRSRQSS